MPGIGAVNNAFSGIGIATTDDDVGGKKELGQADFLQLLVAQVQHQNPLEPQENGEFIAQMAQFGTVDGIHNMQKAISALAQSLQSNQAISATNLVGHSVMIPSETGFLPDGESIKGAIPLPCETSDLVISIYSEQGELVKTLKLGTQPAGEAKFEWDGTKDDGTRMDAGSYRIQAEGTLEGTRQAMTAMVSANVNSVTMPGDGHGLLVNLQGIGPVSLEDITTIN